MKAIFIKSADSLRPASQEAMRILAQYAPGDEVLIDHTRGRSARNHRRAFAFFRMTWEWQDEYDDEENWRLMLEAAAGHGQFCRGFDGIPVFLPKSIAWDKLPDEDEFRKVFGNVVNAYLRRYGAGLNAAQLNMVSNF